jgi:hypothetical protein
LAVTQLKAADDQQFGELVKQQYGGCYTQPQEQRTV